MANYELYASLIDSTYTDLTASDDGSVTFQKILNFQISPDAHALLLSDLENQRTAWEVVDTAAQIAALDTEITTVSAVVAEAEAAAARTLPADEAIPLEDEPV